MYRLIPVYLLLLLTNGIFAQKVKNDDSIYDNNIQTVLLHHVSGQLNPPVIRLGSNDRLRLSFDDFSEESYLFRYTLVHCTKDWETSDLEQMEYLDGFYEGEILDYAFSFNAIPAYIHYELVFPDPEVRIKLSGNYILKVYVDTPNDENVVFTRRFFVVEQLVRVEATIPYYPKNLLFTRKKQQIDLMLFTPDLFNAEPEERISVSIRQNGRWDNMKSGLKPTSIMMNQLEYNYADGIVFDGGNQFRNFDMKSFWYQSMYIRRIISDENGYNVILHTDYPKAHKPYEVVEDINGKRLVKARKDQNTTIEGEYAWVDFSLKYNLIRNADIYILGALNDWKLDKKNKMRYDPDTRMYRGDLLLKQGYYDYMYAVVPQGKTRGDVTLIEGDHWETDNDYTFYVYYREKVPEYDRLVGYAKINSVEDRTK
ncbi:MAG: DUF5103 domain-containing protein [Bacteroidales bacterium]|nr:DUF5103 domain-containing protein [Bacteroidales bacterium]MCF6342361.1 DUF5103 domain-containing protein [Bacteroidales bacterium]